MSVVAGQGRVSVLVEESVASGRSSDLELVRVGVE